MFQIALTKRSMDLKYDPKLKKNEQHDEGTKQMKKIVLLEECGTMIASLVMRNVSLHCGKLYVCVYSKKFLKIPEVLEKNVKWAQAKILITVARKFLAGKPLNECHPTKGFTAIKQKSGAGTLVLERLSNEGKCNIGSTQEFNGLLLLSFIVISLYLKGPRGAGKRMTTRQDVAAGGDETNTKRARKRRHHEDDEDVVEVSSSNENKRKIKRARGKEHNRKKERK